MPEQQSARANPITSAAFEAPFESPAYPLGQGSIDLAAAPDAVAAGDYRRLTNLYQYDHQGARRLRPRPGLINTGSAGAGPIHSASRMDLPATGSFVRVLGSGTELYLGATGALGLVDTGFSGDPFTLLPHRPPLSGQPWCFVGDTAKMVKVRADGLVTPIGLPAPDFPPGLVLATERQTAIATFTGGTAPTGWTPNAGFYAQDATATSAPRPTLVPQITATSFVYRFSAAVPRGVNKAYVFWGKTLALDLSTVGGVPAADDDLMHLTMALSHPWYIEEIRLYVVVSAVFSASVLPGLSQTANQDFYVRSFRPTDFAPLFTGLDIQVDTAEVERVRALRQEALQAQSSKSGYERARAQEVIRRSDTFLAQYDPARRQSSTAGSAAAETVEFGIVGNPLRRGDWQRRGSTAGRDWATVTGLIVSLHTTAAPQENLSLTLGTWYLTGGAGPDSSDPGAQSYDARYTHYDPRTGAEGNPSPVMEASTFIDALRRGITATPAAFGDAAVRQRFYFRGGTLTDDWYFAGENTVDGGVFTLTESDLALAAAGTVEIDHFQPVPTVDDAGDTVLAQPVPVIFGPYNGQLFALGDPHRPGYVYACIPEEPDHWPADLAHEVCSPSEQLMNGVMFGGQPYVVSRDRWYVLYPNLTGAASGMTSQPTGASRGLAGRWGLTVGGGWIWFVAEDGVYRTTGSGMQLVSQKIAPLFLGETVEGYAPIDFTNGQDAIRLTYFRTELYFSFQDTSGDRQVWVYQPSTERWWHYQYTPEPGVLANEEGDDDFANLLVGSNVSGTFYIADGVGDDGQPVACQMRTGSWDWGRPREEKLFGDQYLDADLQGVELTWQNFFNAETVSNPAESLVGPVGRTRVIFDNFGLGPQRARNLAIDLSFASATVLPELYFIGTALTIQPDLTINRVTNWDDLGTSDEKYLTGVTFDCDTAGVDRTIIIERDWQGAVSTVATLTVNTDGRHKVRFSWPALPANQIRIRPDDECLAWLLYRADWIAKAEPPRIAGWDIHFENGWDQYYTGLDLYCDTAGATKQIEVSVDGVVLVNPATGNPWWDVTTTARQVVHLTLPWGRGHVFHFRALDANPGLLYQHRWHLVEEPSEQHNWNQPFTVLGTQADKWLKGVLFEVDTFGQPKTVGVEADGVIVDTLTVTANGRRVVQLTLPNGQKLGRVWRFFPSDANPSRLYSLRPIFDEEPFQLAEWETQEINHGLNAYQTPVAAHVTLKSTADVTLRVRALVNQATGLWAEDDYAIPSTAGVKLTRYVPFTARKGILFKYRFLPTPETPFWLYQEESSVTIQPWMGGDPLVVRPFGNADVDPTRSMVNATLAATRSGGSA